jgi:hypothetical protein
MGGAQFFILDGVWLIAANIRSEEDCTVCDLYRNLDDFEFGFVMERDAHINSIMGEGK